MNSKKKQISIIIILIIAIFAAGAFALYNLEFNKSGEESQKASAPSKEHKKDHKDEKKEKSKEKDREASKDDSELKLLIPVTEYHTVENFVSKYNDNDNKYTIDLIHTETSEDIDPEEYDGLIIPGGKHVHPSFYGEEPDCHYNHKYVKELDELEIALVKIFKKAKKPILGLCRGCQLINVALGGTLKQDIGMEHYKDAVRDTTILKNSDLYKQLGEHINTVHYHHQAIDKLAEGLIITMEDTDDGTIEGYVHKDLPIIAYQFHPDRMYVKKDPQIIKDGLFFMNYFFDICENAESPF